MSERREVRSLAALTSMMFVRSIGFDGGDDSSDDSSEIMDWDTDEEEEEDEDNEGVLRLLFLLSTIFRHGEVYAPIEDTRIEFGRRMVIADFNESQCIQHFRVITASVTTNICYFFVITSHHVFFMTNGFL